MLSQTKAAPHARPAPCNIFPKTRAAPQSICRSTKHTDSPVLPMLLTASVCLALVTAPTPALAETPTIGPKLGLGAAVRGNNGYERKDLMKEFQQRIAERAGQLPKAPNSPPVRPPLGGQPN